MGIQGLRGILILGAPMLVTEMLRQSYLVYRRSWQKENLFTVGWCILNLFAGCAGTLLPVSIGQETSRNVRKGFSRLLQTVFPDVVTCLGLTDVKISGGGILFRCFVRFNSSAHVLSFSNV